MAAHLLKIHHDIPRLFLADGLTQAIAKQILKEGQSLKSEGEHLAGIRIVDSRGRQFRFNRIHPNTGTMHFYCDSG
jgi:hypothetical protein